MPPKKKFFRSGKKSKNRKRFFDFLPLFKILFDPDGSREGGDLTFDTASASERISFGSVSRHLAYETPSTVRYVCNVICYPTFHPENYSMDFIKVAL
jgi:hypothetical protein